MRSPRTTLTYLFSVAFATCEAGATSRSGSMLVLPASRPQVDHPRGCRTSPRSPRLGFSELRFWVEASRGLLLPRTLDRTWPSSLGSSSPGPVRWIGAAASLCTDRGYETRTVSFPYCVSMNRPRLVFLRSPRGSGRAVGSMSPRNYKPFGE